jgi:hypothetical protein
MCEYGILKPVKVILRRTGEEGEWWKWIKPGTIHVYMEMSQWNPLYNYHIIKNIFKMFKKMTPALQKKKKKGENKFFWAFCCYCFPYFSTGLEYKLRASNLLYHLNHASGPFCSGYFGDEGSRTRCPGWPWTTIFQISASQVASIISMSHWHWAENEIISFAGKQMELEIIMLNKISQSH